MAIFSPSQPALFFFEEEAVQKKRIKHAHLMISSFISSNTFFRKELDKVFFFFASSKKNVLFVLHLKGTYDVGDLAYQVHDTPSLGLIPGISLATDHARCNYRGSHFTTRVSILSAGTT